MKLKAEIQGETVDLDIRRTGNHVSAVFGDQAREVEVRELSVGTYLIFAGDRPYECRVEEGSNGFADVYVAGHRFSILVSDPRRLRLGGKGKKTEGASQIVAAMAGKIVRVMVAKGDLVEHGDHLLVVEAMKMQNEMKAPRSGRVTTVAATPGATVNAGDVLIVIE